MKTELSSFAILLGAILFCTVTVKASDNDSTKLDKKIIKMVKVDEKGTFIIDSTITMQAGKAVVHVDTAFYPGEPRHKFGGMAHGKGNRMMYWKDEDGENYNLEIDSDGDSTDILVFGDPDHESFDRMQEEEGFPSHKKIMMMSHDENMPVPPVPPIPPCYFSGQNSRGIIDLNDPSIISFEKKTQKDGTEKITIVRKLE